MPLNLDLYMCISLFFVIISNHWDWIWFIHPSIHPSTSQIDCFSALCCSHVTITIEFIIFIVILYVTFQNNTILAALILIFKGYCTLAHTIVENYHDGCPSYLKYRKKFIDGVSCDHSIIYFVLELADTHIPLSLSESWSTRVLFRSQERDYDIVLCQSLAGGQDQDIHTQSVKLHYQSVWTAIN